MTKSNQSMQRAAGIFLAACGGLVLAMLINMAIRQGWFERKVSFFLVSDSAGSLRTGTNVEINGMIVGKVAEIYLGTDDKVRIVLSIRSQYSKRITLGTEARIVHPLLMGERTIELRTSSELLAQAPDGSELRLLDSVDPISFLKGDGLANTLTSISSLLTNLDGIAKQANQKKNLENTIGNIAALTAEMRKALPHYTDNAVEMSKNISGITRNLNSISTQINELMPVVQELAKAGPTTSQNLAETLKETKILVKALQRNFFIRGNANDVRDEESAKERAPASLPEGKGNEPK
jgi:phospholipid/cholesterol/gamma-HCH transport system substrate-binding protein